MTIMIKLAVKQAAACYNCRPIVITSGRLFVTIGRQFHRKTGSAKLSADRYN